MSMSGYSFSILNPVFTKLSFYCVVYPSVISNVYGQNDDITNVTIIGSDLTTPKCIHSVTANSSIENDVRPIDVTFHTSPPHELHEQELAPDQLEVLNGLRQQGLYYSLKTVMEDINIHKLKTGIVDLMSVHNRSEWIYRVRQSYQARDQIKKKKRMIFINIETVYSSKREQITKAVARRLRGKQMTCPPKFMGDIRVILGPGVARKLYYSLTKYSTSHHVQQVLSTQAVVLERYWLHHAAFTISKFYNETDLPPRGHHMYRWPRDLLAPDVLFFVNATKNVGLATGFDQPYTAFTERLIQVFRRVDGVKVVELSPSKNYLVVVKNIISYIREQFRDHPDINLPGLDLPGGVLQKDITKR
ncbi:UMP-CMP kinase 2, mitochondrial-like isoform X1 [Homalodisca vitripennis]|uniref:UMP-CMP kinase 2, mitochondrial-like isoform X1 n=2 Tax=Homalodisca vitripennis TaxID=197043 RepID=UPI001EEAB209|nr:UMP-CMP kinase 2, mitochondrial-like isoform X1 [Homalodisca vitripennis]